VFSEEGSKQFTALEEDGRQFTRWIARQAASCSRVESRTDVLYWRWQRKRCVCNKDDDDDDDDDDYYYYYYYY